MSIFKTRPKLIYAAHNRCLCGMGLAYDLRNKIMSDPRQGYWDCSGIILGTADQSVKHEAKLPFVFYDIKSEGQPSANGATTRPNTKEER